MEWAARRPRVAESAGAHDHAVITDTSKEVDRIVRDKASLYGADGEFGSNRRLEKLFNAN